MNGGVKTLSVKTEEIKIEKKSQVILEGSSQLLQKGKKVKSRVEYMLDSMPENRAFLTCLSQKNEKFEKLLHDYRQKYSDYRTRWGTQPRSAVEQKLIGPDLLKEGFGPLCVDIETASICDLACSFCFREAIATPDKIINEDLYKKIIDQAVELGVPSVKLNWRGEPLLNPKLPELIAYAKDNGILETIINTNATKLTEEMSERLIAAGLDLIIYSFDGGTPETYEKMRPGRFKKNKFEDVYNNIVSFSRVREKMGKNLPMTKIQMILTADTFHEQESFFSLFNDFVDEVTVTQYSERGGNLEDLSYDEKKQFFKLCEKHAVSVDKAAYLRDADGNLKIAFARKPCEQPFQRLLVTYDGRVAMCCYDWGAMHPVGYVSDLSFEDTDFEFSRVIAQMKSGKAGFELMKDIKMPPKFNQPEKIVQTLRDIWAGNEIAHVRQAQLSDVNSVRICSKCSFKDTYKWLD